MTDIHARMLAKPAFVVTQIKKNGISNQLFVISEQGYRDIERKKLTADG